MTRSNKVAVIGAGMAGVSAARQLTAGGLDVVLFEKSRGIGGRCATRRWGEHSLDHGAQYFTARTEAFRDAIGKAAGDEIREIQAPVLDESGRELDGGPRHYHVKGNSRLVRAMAGSLEVRLGVEVGPVEERVILGETFDAIVTTAPLPQSRRLCGLELSAQGYIPCLTLLAVYRGDPAGPAAERYAVSDRSGAPLAWSACENHKYGRMAPGFTGFVVQASESFSREWLEAEPELWAAELRQQLEQRWDIPASRFEGLQTHRWRYARSIPDTPVPAWPDRWYFAGDALAESRVESAWEVGCAVAGRVLSELQAA